MNKKINTYIEMKPYDNTEVNNAIKRIIIEPAFKESINFLFGLGKYNDIVNMISNISTVWDFQRIFMHPAIRNIINKSSSGLSFSGFDCLQKQKKYLFISNHRDIVLDSAILQILLVENNFDTSEISFGNNLMKSQFIIDLGKVNKMFTVYRDGTKREIYENSLNLSKYIRNKITNNLESVWIAQRAGRTKDGNDSTQYSLLKMLYSSSNKTFTEAYSELNICPMVISYQYEPCDFLKTQELYNSLDNKYIKQGSEDINSIIVGISQFKGKIHLAITDIINKEILNIDNSLNDNQKIKILASIIDNKIYSNYKLWDTNYIAWDLLNNENRFVSKYDINSKQMFIEYINKGIQSLIGDKLLLNKILLSIYANPINNIINCK